MSEDKIETNKSNSNNSNYLKIVKAIYPFKGENNDELCFEKNDLIILTQTPEGGWYEGTHLLNRITGWFPAGYVIPLPPDHAHSLLDQQFIDSFNKDNGQQMNRNLVFQELLNTEKSYICELQNTFQNCLLPLQKSLIFPLKEMVLTVECFQEVITSHLKFLNSLESLNLVNCKDQKAGEIFMNHAASIKSAHIAYCSLHPKFIHLIEINREKVCLVLKQYFKKDDLYNESLLLTAGLSLSFRHLDRYPAFLQEFQRYTEDAHPDRGNIQRAGFVYRELVTTCLKIRRQKEMEMEVMLGNVKNWPHDSESIQSLGNVVHMGPVNVIKSMITSEEMKKDRYLVLFPANLLLLSVSDEMTSFVYEKKLALYDVTLPRIPDVKSTTNTFELLYTELDTSNKFIFMCQNSEDVRKWVSFLHKYKSRLKRKSVENNKSSNEASVNSLKNISNSFKTNTFNRSKYWANKSLLPHPPIQAKIMESSSSLKMKTIASENKFNNNDILILHVIEAYCVGSDKKSQIGGTQQNHQKFENSQMSYIFLQKEVENLKKEVNLLNKNLKNEQKARRRLKVKLEQVQAKIA